LPNRKYHRQLSTHRPVCCATHPATSPETADVPVAWIRHVDDGRDASLRCGIFLALVFFVKGFDGEQYNADLSICIKRQRKASLRTLELRKHSNIESS